MRDIFIKKLSEKSKKNKKIFLIVGDLGFSVIEKYKNKFPNRFVNAGVSEQNMMGMAAGVASENMHVFVYSIANFPTFRCAEQIRNDVDYHNLPVTIVSVGAGVSYGHLGYSHHALQDYGLMRLFPNMLISSPGNNDELIYSLNYLLKNPQPSYLRIDKSTETKFKIIRNRKILPAGLNKLIINDPKKAIITTGNVQELAKKILLKKYKDYSLLSMPMWGMRYKKQARRNLNKFKKIITFEDHFEDGGFGSWIKECLKSKDNVKVDSKFIKKEVISQVGSKKFLLEKYGPGS